MSPYIPAWWLPGPHLPTLWAARGRPAPPIAAHPERLELPDGDFVDLVWAGNDSGPLVVVLHGLEGSFASPYARRVMHAVASRGWGACLLQFRGCSGVPNRLARCYHSGDTGDLDFLVTTLRSRWPDRALCVVGYSMGGNVLLKWLGEHGSAAPVHAAAAVSVPFELAAAAQRLNEGFSRVYQAHLLASLRMSLDRKFATHDLPFSRHELARVRTFHEYDDRVTAPLHGFAGADDYYARASSRQFIPGIRIPTLILHARDDPFLPERAIPQAHECPSSVSLEVPARGGHVGFITDPLPGLTRPWLEERIVAFLGSVHMPGTGAVEASGAG
ncbi:MAG: hypothetical protein RL434_1580 [Pseudomonadota bacterium]